MKLENGGESENTKNHVKRGRWKNQKSLRLKEEGNGYVRRKQVFVVRRSINPLKRKNNLNVEEQER